MATSDNIKDLYEKVNNINNKLAKCRGDQQLLDHDNLIKMGERVSKLNETQSILIATVDNISNNIIDTSSNLNQLADKISQITQNDRTKSRLLYTIISGIIISVISAIIIFFMTTTINTIKNNDDKIIDNKMEKIMQKLDEIEKTVYYNREKNAEKICANEIKIVGEYNEESIISRR